MKWHKHSNNNHFNYFRPPLPVFVLLELGRVALYAYLHHKLIKTLCNIDSGFCTAFSIQTSIFPSKVYSFLFADNPFTFLKYEIIRMKYTFIHVYFKIWQLTRAAFEKTFPCKFLMELVNWDLPSLFVRKRNYTRQIHQWRTLSTLFPTSILMQSWFVEYKSISLAHISDRFVKVSRRVTSYTVLITQIHWIAL